MSQINSSKRNNGGGSRNQNYPSLEPHLEEVLIIVKTAPNPSVSYRETVCTAGITRKGKWIRLYPVSYRYLHCSKQYKKYQWIKVKIEKHEKDFRIDSYRPTTETITIGKQLPPKDWKERSVCLLPTVSSSLEDIKEKYKKYGVSLGMFKPQKITGFKVEQGKTDWSAGHKKVLSQQVLFGRQPKSLEKIPFKFSYCFQCNDRRCKKNHKLQIIDWEIYELYRNLKNRYNYSIDTILEKMKQKWLCEFWQGKLDSYLIVGSIFPKPVFVCLGVYRPPLSKKPTQQGLFKKRLELSN